MDNKIRKLIEGACEKSELFSGIKLPLNTIHTISAQKNEHLTNISDNAVVLILLGQVEVYSTSLSGDEVYLSTLTVGDCTGISNIFNKNPLNTVIKCSTDVEALCISQKVIREMMKENFLLTERFLTIYNDKIQFLIERIESLTIQSANMKLVHYILNSKNSENYVITKSKQKLSEFLGISRASLYREIAYLKENKVIETEKRFIYIKNEEALRKLLL